MMQLLKFHPVHEVREKPDLVGLTHLIAHLVVTHGKDVLVICHILKVKEKGL